MSEIPVVVRYGIPQMMSVGRGRGRCTQNEDTADGIHRRQFMPPADVSSTLTPYPSSNASFLYTIKFQYLDEMFQGSVEDLTVYWVLHNYLLKEPSTPSDIGKMISYIFSKVIADASNVEHIAKYVYLFSKHPKIGELLKRKFFSTMELMYNDREVIRSLHGIHGYRNFIAFFSAVTHYTRNHKFAPFDDLINALCILFQPLISSNQDEDLKLFAICMVRYSKYLKMISSKGVPVSKFAEGDFLEIGMTLRKKITCSSRDGISETAANWLMLAFEASTAGYDAIPEPIKLYYSCVLGPQINTLSTKNEVVRIPKNESYRFILNDVAEIVSLV